MSTSHAILKLLRKLHLYIGVFIAPALLFFAFTVAVQIFSLHETTQGSSYEPPAWLVTLGQLHKKQTTIVPVRKPKPPSPDTGEPAPGKAAPDQTPKNPDAAPRPKSHLLMKIFFLLVAIGLFTSTATGIYMAYKYSRRRLVITGLLVAGVVIPLLLLPF
jgi:hypothetical protein